jgi:hypothetical protein
MERQDDLLGGGAGAAPRLRVTSCRRPGRGDRARARRRRLRRAAASRPEQPAARGRRPAAGIRHRGRRGDLQPQHVPLATRSCRRRVHGRWPTRTRAPNIDHRRRRRPLRVPRRPVRRLGRGRAESLEPAALLASLKAGSYYSTQGPEIQRLDRDGEQLHVATSRAHTIALGGAGDRWLEATTVLDKHGGLVSEGTFDLSAFRGSYCRVTVVDTAGRRAWSNPIWP